MNDKNGNGANDGEPGLADWTVRLSKDGSEVSTITREDGSYRFENLALGTYTLSQELQSGWTRTAPAEGSYSVELKDADVTGRDFGNELTSYSISGKMFNDLNNDGVNDGEPGLAGWTIQLSRDGNVLNTTTTGPDGSYKFDDLAAGTYTLSADSAVRLDRDRAHGWLVHCGAEGCRRYRQGLRSQSRIVVPLRNQVQRPQRQWPER